MHKATFFPLGNADCCRIDLQDGRKILFDYANTRNPDDESDLRCDLPALLTEDLESADKNEFDVVAFLAENAGRDVAYRQIYDVVRGNGFVAGQGEDGYRANVRAMVKRIRRKFTQLDADFAALQNYPGFGYRWHA